MKEKVKFRNSTFISIKCNCNPYRKGRQANSYVGPGYRVRGLQIKFLIFPYIRQAKGTLINANEIVPVGFLLSIILLALPSISATYYTEPVFHFTSRWEIRINPLPCSSRSSGGGSSSKTWSHPLSQSVRSIPMLYISLTVLV